MQQRLWQSAHPPLLGVKSQAPRTTSSLSPNIRASVIREWRFGVYSGGMEGCNIYVSLDVTFVTFSTKLLSCNFPPLKKQRISAEGCKTRFLVMTFLGLYFGACHAQTQGCSRGVLLKVFVFVRPASCWVNSSWSSSSAKGSCWLSSLRFFPSSATVPAGFSP